MCITGISRRTKTINSVIIVYSRQVRVREYIVSLCEGEFSPLPYVQDAYRFRGFFFSIVCRLHRRKSNVPNVYIYNRLQNKSFRLRIGRLSYLPRDRGDKFVSNRRTNHFVFHRQISQFAPPSVRFEWISAFRVSLAVSPFLPPPSFSAGRCWFRPPNGPSFAPAICTKTVSSFPVRIHLAATLLNLKFALHVFTHGAIDLLLFGRHYIAFVVGRDV